MSYANFKVIKREMKFCYMCMKEHEIQTVEIIESDIMDDVELSCLYEYDYCKETNTFIENEYQITKNMIAFEKAYGNNGFTTDE